jgi:serine/threonine protein kinase
VPIDAGTRLGRYEIVAPLGSGGMGEVYRARDVRLGRTVAVKTLPGTQATAEERQRFEDEARAVAALNHPNICALFDVGAQDDTEFLVMECLAGETLATRLERGPLEPSQAVEYAIQIAEALAAAHAAGVVHRDLKPANVMLTPTGVKLLDFGLARLQQHEGASALAATRLTSAGLVVGTVPYMAPEQIEGRRIDARVDVFAFGAVLHEMLTGRRAFEGDSAASVMSAVLRDMPPAISSIRSDIPVALERLVTACLVKQPDERWHCARDLSRELRWIRQDAGRPFEGSTRRYRYRTTASLVGAAIVMAAGAAALLWPTRGDAPADARVLRLEIPPPPESTLLVPSGPPFLPQFALSPDGTRLAFVASLPDGRQMLYTRDLASHRTEPVPGSEGAMFPFWAPDSRRIAFFTQTELKRVDGTGEAPRVLAQVPDSRGGGWMRDDMLIFVTMDSGTLMRMPAGGGTPIEIGKPASATMRYVWPCLIPGSDWVLLGQVDLAAPGVTTVLVSSITGSSPPRELLQADGQAVFAPPGTLLFVRSGILFAQPFDPVTATLSGSARRLLDGVAATTPAGAAAISASGRGDVAYAPAYRLGEREMTWVGRDGRPLATVGPPGDYISPSLSPDDRHIAIRRSAADLPAGVSVGRPRLGGDIWIFDVARGGGSRFTFESAHEASPVWSPDGRLLAYTSMQQGLDDLWIKPFAVEGPAGRVQKGPAIASDWSADGRLIAYHVSRGGWQFDLEAVTASPPHESRPLVKTPFLEVQGRFSPDGRWLAYASNESGAFEVYAQRLDGAGRPSLVSIGGGAEPAWRRDGKELFYLAPDGTMMGVAVRAGDGIQFERPVPLFRADPGPLSIPYRQRYAVSGDGNRFLLLLSKEPPPPVTIGVLANLLAE